MHIWNGVRKRQLANEVPLKKLYFIRVSIFIHILRVYFPFCLPDTFYLSSFEWTHHSVTVFRENMLCTASVTTPEFAFKFWKLLLWSTNSFWNLETWKRTLKFDVTNELFLRWDIDRSLYEERILIGVLTCRTI